MAANWRSCCIPALDPAALFSSQERPDGHNRVDVEHALGAAGEDVCHGPGQVCIVQALCEKRAQHALKDLQDPSQPRGMFSTKAG